MAIDRIATLIEILPTMKNNDQLMVTRHWELLKLIPARGKGITASKLLVALDELGFHVSKRSIERDLITLSKSFGLVCDDRSKPYHWRWMDNANSQLPSLTLADALSLRLIEDTTRAMLPSAVLFAIEARFRQARDKLEEMTDNNRIARWVDKVRFRQPTLPLVPPQIDRDILDVVQDAILNEHQLEVLYQSVDADQARQIRLNPLAMAQRGVITYLVAMNIDYDDVRLYAIHRIQEAHTLDEQAKIPDDFSIDAYLDQGALEFGDGEVVMFKAWVHESLMRHLKETPLTNSMSVTDEEDEWFHIETEIKNSWQLRWWILSQGSCIIVQEPIALRKIIVNELREASSYYEED